MSSRFLSIVNAKSNSFFVRMEKMVKARKIKKIVTSAIFALLFFAPMVFAWPSVFPKGTTIYEPNKCFNGYTLTWLGEEADLFDMNGKIVHSWKAPTGKIDGAIGRARLEKNGNLLVLRGKGKGAAGEAGMEEYDWDGNLLWQYICPLKNIHGKPLSPHHDYFKKPNGNILMIYREIVPDEYMKKITAPWLADVNIIYSDAILEIKPEKEIAWEWHGHEYLNLNQYRIP